MGRSERLRAGDVAAVYELLGQCRELGADAQAWQRHLLTSLHRVIGCKMAGAVETVPTLRGLDNDWATHLDLGWTDGERQLAAEALRSGEFPADQFCLRLSKQFVQNQPHELTRTRRQLIDDSQWFGSDTCELHRQTGSSDVVMSLSRIDGRERTFCLGLIRAVGDRGISAREARVLELLCRLIRPHLGRGLALLGEPGVAELSLRRREVLGRLLQGLAEKQIARELGLSPPTVHQYVCDLHRHFGVGSRGELLALFLRRFCGPPDQWVRRLADVEQ